ncbi:unnamed protein product, partial [Polarella glacialis]
MKLDWNMLGEKFTKEIYSSDFAMPYALAARAWTVGPWEESAQMHESKDKPHSGRMDAAFRHYSGPVGKPTYDIQMTPAHNKLVKEQPAKYRGKDPNCQVCYNLERYIALWGSAECTNRQPVKYSQLLMERYHPELETRKCDLTWLCEPGKKMNWRELIRYPALLNLADVAGWTPLHIAAHMGRRMVITRLLQARASPDRRNSRGYTPAELCKDPSSLSAVQLGVSSGGSIPSMSSLPSMGSLPPMEDDILEPSLAAEEAAGRLSSAMQSGQLESQLSG